MHTKKPPGAVPGRPCVVALLFGTVEVFARDDVDGKLAPVLWKLDAFLAQDDLARFEVLQLAVRRSNATPL